MNTDFPTISVVIPIKNEARFIETTIRKILEQDYPADRIEIIVACGESEDGSTDIVRRLAENDKRICYFQNNVGRASGGRNIGIRHARGDIIIFIDGHTYIADPQLLKNTVLLMNEKEVDVLSRPQFLEPPENNYFQQAVALARRSVIGHGLDSTIYTDKDLYVEPTSSGAAYKKEVFHEFGLYDENFDACEDVEFNYRLTKAGKKSFTSMKLAVYYYPRDTMRKLFVQMKRYGIGRFRLARKHLGTLTVGNLIPVLFTGGMPTLALAGLFLNSALNLFLLLSALYLLIILIGSAAVAMRDGLKYLPTLPAIYMTIHVGLGWGFLFESGRAIMGKSPVLKPGPH